MISIRVPADLKQRISDHLRATGKTYTQWVTELFEGQADHAREVEEAYDRGFRECARWLARLYLEDEEQFEAFFGGLVWLASREMGREAGNLGSTTAAAFVSFRPVSRAP